MTKEQKSAPARGPGRRKGSGARAGADAAWGLRAVQALADPSRWRIVEELRTGPAPLGTLAARLGLSLGCTSRHISILKESGVVRSVRKGRSIVCSLPESGSAEAELLALLGDADVETVSAYISNQTRGDSDLAATAPEFAKSTSKPRVVNSIDIEDYLL
jgi:DNA-binding transcriptional ArsR family regulator